MTYVGVDNFLKGVLVTFPWATNDTAFEDYVRTLFPVVANSVLSYITLTIYPPLGTPGVPYKTDIDRAVLLTGEVLAACSTYSLDLACGNRTYNYIFDVPPAIYGDDLHYNFGPDPSTKDQGVRVLLQDYVTTFAETGNPNGPGVPSFDMYGSHNRILDLFPGSVPMRPDPSAWDRSLQLQEQVYG